MWIVTALLVYIRVCLQVKGFTDNVLNTDLHDIDEYYKDDSRMFVAELDGQVVDMAGIARKGYHQPGVAELKRISVSSAIRNRGIGKKLLKQVEQFCKAQKYNRVVLETTGSQYAALGLYKKFGFEIEHIDPFPAMEDIQLLFLEKRLESEDWSVYGSGTEEEYYGVLSRVLTISTIIILFSCKIYRSVIEGRTGYSRDACD